MLIAIDHGNKQMKTIHSRPFVSGLMESITRPFGSDLLEYQGKFYTLSNQRIPYKRDKTEDDRFFILTLFGIAEELHLKERYGEEVVHVSLAVGIAAHIFNIDGIRVVTVLEVYNAPVGKIPYKGLILCPIMCWRKPHGQRHMHHFLPIPLL